MSHESDILYNLTNDIDNWKYKMSDIDYKEYDFNVKGIIEVNLPEGVLKITTSGLKETLIKIQAVNLLRKAGKNVTPKIKGDKVLEELVQKISGDIEVLSHEAT